MVAILGKRKLLIWLIVIVIILAGIVLMFLPRQAQATSLAEQPQRVFDYAQLLNDAEKTQLETEIASMAAQINMDIVFLSRNGAAGEDALQVATDFYDNNGFGVSTHADGIIFYLDMGNRYQEIVASGRMINHVDDLRIEEFLDVTGSYLQNDDWAGAIRGFLAQLEMFMASYGDYRYDEQTGLVTDSGGTAITGGGSGLSLLWIAVSLVIGLLAGLIMLFSIRRKYRMKESAYTFNLQNNALFNVVALSDDFLRTSESRVRIHHDNYGGGGSSGGGGAGGKSVFTGSSGRSHVGGGRKF